MPTRVLFVCLGNICRSPLAEGIFRHLARQAGIAERFHVDSAGTGAWHAGDPPDPRAREVARRRGVSLDGQRARQVAFEDFIEYDLIIAMDTSNKDDLLEMAPPAARERIRLLREFDPRGGVDVPDPYFGGGAGFDEVFDLIHRSCEALLARLRQEAP